MSTVSELAPAALYRACTPDFSSTAELTGTTELIGQARAVEALEFAIDVQQPSYNAFVIGPPGSGRRSFVASHLAQVAARAPNARDWCYVNDFEQPERPRVLALPAGVGKRLAADVDRFIYDAQTAVSASFASEEYRARRLAIERGFQEQQGQAFAAVQNAARERGIRILQTPNGMVFAPVVDGAVLGPEEFAKLPPARQRDIEQTVNDIGKLFQESMRDLPERLRVSHERIAELDRELAELAIDRLAGELIQRYRQLADAHAYLEAMRGDLVRHYDLLRGNETGDREPPFRVAIDEDNALDGRIHRRYGINVLVAHTPGNGAPVVIEDRPTYARLIGKIEHRARFGALSTDFKLIRPGCLHEANGGYLVMNAERLLSEPFAWDALKQSLRARTVRIVPLDQLYGLVSTTSLEPAPIPLDIKVILIGSPRLYHLLRAFDAEFDDFFKVVVEFDDRSPRDASSERLFAERLTGLVRDESLLPLAGAAVARIIEEAARETEDRERISTVLRRSLDLVREAHYYAHRRQASLIEPVDVEEAITRKEARAGRSRERVLEDILRDTTIIATAGYRVGQVNGLSVHVLGEQSFGRPSRISARVSFGQGDIIDIEREAELGGALHSKGVMILSGYLAARYASDVPAAFAATLAFEQSYGGVDGDSASSTELYALISALAAVPLRQDLAVTGSVNQFGDVQAIGGVNVKIEGFFDICAARGLTGTQGVLIPAANAKHLRLRSRVVEAVAAGQFHIYAIEHVDQGLELLTGLAASSADESVDTLERHVRQRLLDFAELRRRYAENKTGQPA